MRPVEASISCTLCQVVRFYLDTVLVNQRASIFLAVHAGLQFLHSVGQRPGLRDDAYHVASGDADRGAGRIAASAYDIVRHETAVTERPEQFVDAIDQGTPEMLRESAQLATEHGVPLLIHIAETEGGAS